MSIRTHFLIRLKSAVQMYVLHIANLLSHDSLTDAKEEQLKQLIQRLSFQRGI